MKDLGKKIKITIENETIEFILLKEFAYKKDNYILVMDSEKDECETHDGQCGCEDDCEDSCGCCNEKSLYIFKVDNDKYSYIEDEKELDEVIKHIDKIFYEE
jgi:hypothetical protein